MPYFLALALLSLGVESVLAAPPLSIRRITPDGENIPPARQIVIHFDRPVVPLGRMERSSSEIPITITPQVNCQWRWVDTSTLGCQLGDQENLIESTSYEMVIQPGIKAEDGGTLPKAHTHRFTTQRPEVTYVSFNTWTAPGMPYIQVTFNQPVSKKSVEAHLYFEMGNGKRVSPVVERSKWEKTAPRYIFVRDRNVFLDMGEQTAKTTDDEERALNHDSARRVWMIHPREELEGGTSVFLQMEPGLRSALGPELSKTQRILNQFHTFPEYRFIGVLCEDQNRKEIRALTGSKSSPRCNPLGPKYLEFSSPVVKESIKDEVKFTPELSGGTETDPWESVYSGSQLYQPHRPQKTYRVPLPPYLKAYETYQISGSPKDEFGRSLPEPIHMEFSTDHRAPNFELPSHESVLEKGIQDSELPIYVTNIDKLHRDYFTLDSKGASPKQKLSDRPGKEMDVAFAYPIKVRELLKGKSGVVYGSVSTEPPVSKPDGRDYLFFSQVTPFQVITKMGHFNTLVWVTDMRTGEIVKNAQVEILKSSYGKLNQTHKAEASGKTDESGRALLPGSLELDPKLEVFKSWYDFDEERFFVKVILGDDIALLPLDGSFNIDPYRIGSNEYPYRQAQFGYLKAWGTTAQGLYRVGEKIQYKIYLRDQNNETLVPTSLKDFKLEIVDPTGRTVHTEEKIQLNKYGAFSGEYTTQSNAIAGFYQFNLKHPKLGEEGSRSAMSVLVTDFTPVPFKVDNSLNGDLYRQGDTIKVDTTAKLHSGGPYGEASTRVNTRYRSQPFHTKHNLGKEFYVQTDLHSQDGVINESLGKLNDKGELDTEVELEEVPIVYGKIYVESAVQDDRGKFVAATSTADYRGRTRYVGLKNSAWVYEQAKDARIDFLVMDERGQPVAEKVKIKFEYHKTTVSRVKGSGNAYLTHYNYEWVEAHHCTEKSSATEVKSCVFKPKEAGTYRFTATVEDTNGLEHSTQLYGWVTGRGNVVWETGDNNALQVVAETAEPKIGDTVRYLIKNPYPGATALISIERYGIIESWTQKLETSTPIVEFKVKPHYMPGFYLSIAVVSKRAADSKGFGELDLGKPSFKMASVRVPVKDPYKEIHITAQAEKEVYRPRDKVKIALQARPRHINKGGEPIELAVAVLDESVFDLVPGGKKNFDPYEGFYNLGTLDVHSYTTLLALLGRQKFEKKGANPGGSGGIDGPDGAMRNLFKFVAYWNPSLGTDKHGRATLEFELPDNLTGWRILAMAVTPTDRLGLGDGNFKVNRPTEVRPVMPNQVTEGDDFKAGFSVMNRTEKARTVEVSIKVTGNVKAPNRTLTHKETVTLDPYKRVSVWMNVPTTAVERQRGIEHGELKFEVSAGDSVDKDGLVHSVPVNKMRSLLTAANYGTTTENSVEESILFPKQMHSDVGSVSVTASPTVIGNAEGAFKYIKSYPYGCWEQRLTKGVMASHYSNLRPYLPETLVWDEAKELPQTTLNDAAGFQAPNGGMVFFVPEDRNVSPYLSAYTALAFNWLRDRGYKVPGAVEEKLHGYLLDLLRRDVFPSFYSEGMSSSVRAVALAALAPRKKIKFSDIQRYEKHVKQMDLFGKAHYLTAALHFKEADSIADAMTKMILNQSDKTAGKFQFLETLDDSYTRILSSPLRSNCAVLSSFSAYAKSDKGRKLVDDVPFRMVRFITQARGSRDHFENTQENMFCMNALVEYSKLYESVTPKMTITALMNGQKFGEGKFTSFKDPMQVYERNIQPSDPGSKAKVKIERKGNGRLYYATRVEYAPQSTFSQLTNSGIDVRREYSVERNGKWELLKNDAVIKRGEIVRVDLFVSLPAARNFVVVSDPVPGGLEPINRNLANSSTVDADKGEYKASGGSFYLQFSDWNWYNFSQWSFYHQEIRHHAVRYYSDYLSAGRYILSYTAQAIATGKFAAMPVHAEEMYDPDVFGKGMSGTLTVEEK